MDSLISVIIPAYNYANFIAQTLDSVLNQTYKHWECLIIDDGSTDKTREVCEEYINKDSRLYYYYQPNKGRSVARNYGLSMAKGDYIQFLDADDFMSETKFEKQIFDFNDSAIFISYCNFSFFNSYTGNIMETDHYTKQMADPLLELIN